MMWARLPASRGEARGDAAGAVAVHNHRLIDNVVLAVAIDIADEQ